MKTYAERIVQLWLTEQCGAALDLYARTVRQFDDAKQFRHTVRRLLEPVDRKAWASFESAAENA